MVSARAEPHLVGLALLRVLRGDLVAFESILTHQTTCTEDVTMDSVWERATRASSTHAIWHVRAAQ